MKKFKLFLAGLGFIGLSTVAVLSPTPTVSAFNPLEQTCSSSGSSDNPICQNQSEDASSLIGTIVNVLLFIIGLLAVVMIIWGGIMYTTSAGDSGRVKKAKDTLMYSIVGLIVAFLAFAIVNWVLKLF